MQPMIMKAVTEAINSTTSAIMENIREEMNSLMSEREELGKIKHEIQVQRFETEKSSTSKRQYPHIWVARNGG